MTLPAPKDVHVRNKKSYRNRRGVIFDIQRFSIHDGPGIRTTVFLKGCPLRCPWCHNPEGKSADKQLSYAAAKCIGCGYCVRACANKVHSMDPVQGHTLDWDLCRACGQCTLECYSGALDIVGREVTVEDVMSEVLRDVHFYRTSSGGLTLSGGEPLMQLDFTEAILQAAKESGLHCCVETCGHAAFSSFERTLPYVDLFLYDLKDMDDARHLGVTGVSNSAILANLKAIYEHGALVRLRLPIIPGCNDRDDHFRAVADLARALPHLEGVEMIPYHSLGGSKLDRLGGKRNEETDIETPDEETVENWIARFAELGVSVMR